MLTVEIPATPKELQELREKFACYALVGIMAARAGSKGTIINEDECADDAVMVADAMIKKLGGGS